MISNADAAQIIREIRSIDWYLDKIESLNNQIKSIEKSLEYKRPTFVDPLNMQRINLPGIGDARYKAPASKYHSFTHNVEYDSLDEFVEKKKHYEKCLGLALKYKDILFIGEDADFMRDFFNDMPYEGLCNKYHYRKPMRHAKAIIRKKIKNL